MQTEHDFDTLNQFSEVKKHVKYPAEKSVNPLLVNVSPSAKKVKCPKQRLLKPWRKGEWVNEVDLEWQSWLKSGEIRMFFMSCFLA